MPKKQPEPNLYVMHGRDFVLRTKFGHSIAFRLDDDDEPIPTHVPYQCVEEAQRCGAVPVKGTPKTPPKPDGKTDPIGQERTELITMAVEQIIENNNADDFTAGMVPTAAAVKRVVGFGVDRSEINRIHQAVRSREGN